MADEVLEGGVAVYDDVPFFVGNLGGDIGVAVLGCLAVDDAPDGLEVTGHDQLGGTA